MSGDMPERIWAWTWNYIGTFDGKPSWAPYEPSFHKLMKLPTEHSWNPLRKAFWAPKRETPKQLVVEYIRLDAHESALAALRAQVWAEAEKMLRDEADKIDADMLVKFDEGASATLLAAGGAAAFSLRRIAAAIRDLTPTQEARHD